MLLPPGKPTVEQVATKMKVDGMVVTNTTISRPESLTGAAKEGEKSSAGCCSRDSPPSYVYGRDGGSERASSQGHVD